MLHEFLTRLGTFFILLGVGILVLFVASSGAGAANFDYLFWAMVSVIVGFFLRRRREAPAGSERFSLLRRSRGGQREPKERK
jgi:membrane protein implicated in regulation of membrane protease activity